MKQEGRTFYGPEFARSLARMDTGGHLDPSRLSIATERGTCLVSLDLTSQRLGLAVAPEDSNPWSGQKTAAPVLAPSVMDVSQGIDDFLPAVLLGMKAKQFDDGLVAALDMALEEGLGEESGKPDFLEQMLQRFIEQHVQEASERVAASLIARGRADLVPAQIEASAQSVLDRRSQDQTVPLGFYRWNPLLERIYLGDKVLQTAFLDRGNALAAARALAGDPSLAQRYAKTNLFAERLTNSFVFDDLRETIAAIRAGRTVDPLVGEVALFPASRSVETDLIGELYGNRHIPDGFNLVAEIIDRIRAGKLTIEPGPSWYQWQLHALSAVLQAPSLEEGTKVSFDEGYQGELDGLFKALYGATRETHIKQLAVPMAGAGLFGEVDQRVPLLIPILLDIEPLVTYYERRAASYGFVKDLLEEMFGPSTLDELARVTCDGPVNMPLGMELSLMADLFTGAAQRARRLLGLPSAEQETSAESVLQVWRAHLFEDPDLGRDVRMMVPIFFDRDRAQYRVWAILGMASRPIEITYEIPPRVTSVSMMGQDRDKRGFAVSFERSRKVDLPYLVSAELWTSELMDRETFQNFCDQARTLEGILAQFPG